jgi:hypothetical protein
VRPKFAFAAKVASCAGPMQTPLRVSRKTVVNCFPLIGSRSRRNLEHVFEAGFSDRSACYLRRDNNREGYPCSPCYPAIDLYPGTEVT